MAIAPASLSIAVPQCIETLDRTLTTGTNGTAMLVMYSISMAFIVIANSLFIIGLYLTQKKQFTSVHRMFLILSCSDLFAGTVYIPVQIYSIVRRPDITCTLTGIRSFLSVFPIVFSGMTIMFITIDRYLIVARPKTSRIGTKRLPIYVVVTALVSAGWGAWYSFDSQHEISASRIQNIAIFFMALATFEVAVLATSLVFNILIVRSVRASTKNSSLHGSHKKPSEQKLSRTIVIISSALVITYIPSVIGLYVTGSFMYDLKFIEIIFTKHDEMVDHSKALLWTLLPTLINSGLNAAIFIARNTKIRRMYRSVYKRKLRSLDNNGFSESGSDPHSPITGGQNTSLSPKHIRLETLRQHNQ